MLVSYVSIDGADTRRKDADSRAVPRSRIQNVCASTVQADINRLLRGNVNLKMYLLSSSPSIHLCGRFFLGHSSKTSG